MNFFLLAGWNVRSLYTSLPIRSKLWLGLRLLLIAAGFASVASANGEEGPPGYIRRFASMRSLGTYVVMLPPDYEASAREYPLCLILHGNGSTELRHGMLAEHLGREGVIYAAVRAPFAAIRVIASDGREGYTAWPPDGMPEGSLLREQARMDYVDWIFQVVRDIEKDFRTRKGKIYVYGHSQGGQFATVVALLHPEKVASFFSQAGSAAPAELFTPERLQRLKQEDVRVWLVHGRFDTVVPIESSTTLAERLRDSGIPVKLKLVTGDHGINEEMMKLGRKWIKEEVKPSD